MNLFFPVPIPASPADQLQGRLLKLAALFLFFFSVILTLSPAVRDHSWMVTYRWQHWLGLIVWFGLFSVAHRQIIQILPERDPYLLPVISLLAGWGLMTIWRLSLSFGLRQTLWLIVGVGVLLVGLRVPALLQILRKYKYLWLSGGLILTGLTFFFGTYPNGIGPRLWLGCCGVYLQPSEPLKLLLIVYLAAYLADHFPFQTRLSQFLTPSLIAVGLALLLLVAQRDLGTATLLILFYTTVVYIASNRVNILWVSIAGIIVAGIAGYLAFDVVRLRMDAWLNPWLDPSGRSFQIVQSLMAIASGGIFGRGPGLGSPGLVPVAQSDFIFASTVEETGLVGAIGMILLFLLLASRGILAAFRASQPYQRYLATGISVFLIGQSIFIIGGNLRLLPLTGVTLPFVSYGGSSLLTAFLSILLLFKVGWQSDQEPASLPQPRPYLLVSGGIFIGLAAAALLTGWWTIWRSPTLLDRADNPRRTIADLYVQRGTLLDRQDRPINITQGVSGDFSRDYLYPDLSSVVGYTNPVYGQAGLEAELDPYLRGLKGNRASLIWWDHLVYGQPPPGLDVRLTIDLSIQQKADQLLGEHHGGVVLMNARTGEILAIASHPTFDSNTLEQDWQNLVTDGSSPLLDRAAQGQYSPGTIVGPFELAYLSGIQSLPALPQYLFSNSGTSAQCSLPVDNPVDWNTAVAHGCKAATIELGRNLGGDILLQLYRKLGFFQAPAIPLPVSSSPAPGTITNLEDLSSGQENLKINPLQLALASAALTNNGVQPAPRLVLTVITPHQGPVVLPADSQPVQVFQPASAQATVNMLQIVDHPEWETIGSAQNGINEWLTWYVGGTTADWKGTPLAIALVIEENDPTTAQRIGRGILESAQSP